MLTSLHPPVGFQSISVKNKLAKCSVVSWTGSGKSKRTFVETLVTSKNSLEFTVIRVPMLPPQLCKMM